MFISGIKWRQEGISFPVYSLSASVLCVSIKNMYGIYRGAGNAKAVGVRYLKRAPKGDLFRCRSNYDLYCRGGLDAEKRGTDK